MCPLNGTGYGITSTNIALCLHDFGIETSLFPIGNAGAETESVKNKLVAMLNNTKSYNKSAPFLKIWHQHELHTRVGAGKYYAFPFFELNKFHDFEVHQLNQVDELFTASKWGKRILQNNGVNVPIHVAPLGVNSKIFNLDKITMERENYTFLHIGKWELRKGQDFLIEAFSKAFTKEDKVELWLCPHNPFLDEKETEQWMKMAKNSPLSDKIVIFDRFPTQHHLAEAISNADCGVFLSRAEGWNNEIPEMMAMNKPIIATNYSAHTEYLTVENSFLVEIDELEPADDGKWFHGHGGWAKLGTPQLEQTIEHMKYVYNNRVSSNPKGLETAKGLSWQNTSSIIRQTIFN